MVILLDVRYHRDPPGQSQQGDVLGAQQWEWLESVLRESQASMHFIVSGSTIIPPMYASKETWRNYPGAFKRLFKLLKDVSGPVLLTGVRHFSGFMTKQIGGRVYPEFMSSGMTHSKTDNGFLSVLLYKFIWGFGNSNMEQNFGHIRINRSTNTEVVFESRRTDGSVVFARKLKLDASGNWADTR